MTDEEFLSWWYNDFHWTWNYDPSQPLNSATVNYTLPEEIQNYLAAKKWEIGYSVLHDAVRRRRRQSEDRKKFCSDLFARTLGEADNPRNILLTSLNHRWYMSHLYQEDTRTLAELASRVPYGAKNNNRILSYYHTNKPITRDVDINYTVCCFLFYSNEPHNVITNHFKRVTYTINIIS